MPTHEIDSKPARCKCDQAISQLETDAAGCMGYHDRSTVLLIRSCGVSMLEDLVDGCDHEVYLCSRSSCFTTFVVRKQADYLDIRIYMHG